MKHIRNFCIIAHIDHGKSTLADRFIEYTESIAERDMRDQLLDSMDLERERGITIKLQPVRMLWKDVQMNLIDTPGHIDFTYEVSRSLQAVEGALLLVDATQGIQAQTMANVYLAIEQDLKIIPVINKIDLPAADVERTAEEIMHLLGCNRQEIYSVSGKTGEGVRELLDAVIEHVPPPNLGGDDTRALIFDAHYDSYRGVVAYVRLFGGHLKRGQEIDFAKGVKNAEVLEVGFFAPSLTNTQHREDAEIGYVITNIKDLDSVRVGDTILAAGSTSKPLPGYRDVKPMVYASLFPAEANDYESLRKAILKLTLNDASLSYEPDRSEILGFGFRCGFLGLLHLDIIRERLEREFDLDCIITTPTVAYKVYKSDGEMLTVTSPAALPDQTTISRIEQPIARIDLITPSEYMGSVMEYVVQNKGIHENTEFLDETRVILKFKIPLSSIISDFYDVIKNISSGYASYTYDIIGYEECNVVRLDVLVAEEAVPGLAVLVNRSDAEKDGRRIVKKLKDIIPREQFVIKLQAAVGGKIVASERISAMRKDVTAKLYGGDVTRKRKLLEKQKKGKQRLARGGAVQIPSDAYVKLLRKD